MTILENVSLKPYNTFGIDAKAKQFVSVSNLDELKKVLSSFSDNAYLILGGGSNMLLTKDVDALVIHVNLKGIEVIAQTENSVTVSVAAGENWHEFVLWCIDHNFGGVENLSLIPGNVGTAPIQNIGAYGVELKDVFVSCDALELSSKTLRTFTKEECDFDYRNSIFKHREKGNYIITNVILNLTTNNHIIKTSYGAIETELTNRGIDQPNIKDVSDVVVAIRQSKLPNPAEIGNSGSFFKNPVISNSEFESIQANFPDAPHYSVNNDQVKVPAGWLIEKAGFKGKRFGQYGVHKNQALVLVNYGNAKGEDIYKLSKLIQSTVRQIFNINLEAEVNIL